MTSPTSPTIDDAVGPLLDSLARASDPSVRAFSALTLARTARSEVVPPLIAALSDPDKVVRRAAGHALAALGPTAVPALLAALTDSAWVVRYRAAEALGSISDPRVPPALIHLLDDDRDHVRYMAAKGLGEQPVPAAVEPLHQRLDDENPFVRCMAEEVLRRTADRLGGEYAERIHAVLEARD